MTSRLIGLIAISLTVYAFPHEKSHASRNEAEIDGTGEVEDYEICDTDACRQVAKAFSSSMNRAADPCVNFHEYACGNWSSSNSATSYIYSSIWSALDQFSSLARFRLREQLEAEPNSRDILPIQQMKKLYKSCMDSETRDSEGLKPIMARFHETNGWPMAMSDGTWDQDAMTWQEIDHYYEDLLGLNAFYTLKIFESSSGHGKLLMTAPTLISQEEIEDDMTEYRSLIKKLVQLFIEENNASVSDEDLEEDIDDILKLENALYKASQDSSGDVSFTDIPAFIELWNDCVISFPPWAKIHWKSIFRRLLKITNLPMSHDTTFTFENGNYFIKLVKILQSTDERIIANYIQWKFLTHIGEFSAKIVADIISKLLEIDSSRDARPRWLDCIPEEEPAAIHLFGSKYYKKNTKIAVNTLLRTIKNSFEVQATNSNWLSTKAKKAMKQKLVLMTNVDGYPEWYDNETALIDYYEDLEIGNSYIENILSLRRTTWRSAIKLWGKPDVKILVTEVLEANAEYDEDENRLYVAAANFQSPLFDGSLPQYIAYPTVGYTFGHETGHMVDMDEIRSGDLSKDSLFSKSMAKILSQRAQCFVELFNQLSEGSGEETLNENIADHFGMQAAIHAYKILRDEQYPNGELKLPGFHAFTDEQMFFLSYAEQWCSTSDDDSINEHSANKDRILGLVSNTLAFAEAFNCPRNSPMNPRKKCDIWIKPPERTHRKTSHRHYSSRH